MSVLLLLSIPFVSLFSVPTSAGFFSVTALEYNLYIPTTNLVRPPPPNHAYIYVHTSATYGRTELHWLFIPHLPTISSRPSSSVTAAGQDSHAKKKAWLLTKRLCLRIFCHGKLCQENWPLAEKWPDTKGKTERKIKPRGPAIPQVGESTLTWHAGWDSALRQREGRGHQTPGLALHHSGVRQKSHKCMLQMLCK